MHRKIGQKTPPTANRIVECIGSVYRFAAVCGLVRRGENPRSQRPGIPRAEPRALPYLRRTGPAGRRDPRGRDTGVPRVLDNEKPTAKYSPKKHQLTNIGPHAAAAIRLLILTGARLREILNLKWEYVDIERGVLLLPDSKSGRKTIVLNGPALLVLAQLTRTDGYVILGDDPAQARHDLKSALADGGEARQA